MKKYFLIIFLSSLGYIFNISDIDITDKTLFDMEYDKDYVVDMKPYEEGYIPQYTKLFFRLSINTKKNITITIKLLKGEDIPQGISIYFFSKKPTVEDIKNKHISDHSIPSYNEKEIDMPYLKYIFNSERKITDKYIAFYFKSRDYRYISVLVSATKEKKFYDFKEIKYNKEYVIKKTNEYANSFLFWLELKKNEDGAVRIKLHKNDSYATSELWIFVQGFGVNPYTEDCSAIDTRDFYYYDKSVNDSDYIQYYYYYSDLKERVKYLTVIVSNSFNLKYFSIGVGNNITDYNGYLKLLPLRYVFLSLLLLIL